MRRPSAPPADLAVESVTLAADPAGPDAAADGVRGWHFAPTTDAGSAHATACGVVVLHGRSSSKRAMVDRARLHLAAGHAALGISMGGEAICLARPPALAAVIPESTYSTLEAAFADRARRLLGPLGAALLPMARVTYRWRTGCDVASVRPIDHLADLDCPLFVLHGTDDGSTRPEQGRALFDAAQTAARTTWRASDRFQLVEDADHEDLLRADEAAWTSPVLPFLEAAFREPP